MGGERACDVVRLCPSVPPVPTCSLPSTFLSLWRRLKDKEVEEDGWICEEAMSLSRQHL